MEALNQTLGEEFNNSVTENGALGYATTQKPLLDMNYKVGSYRNMDEQTLIADFKKAFYENKILALKWLFYARDIRGGLGERRLFRIITKYLAQVETEYMSRLIPLFAEYGRYDDLLVLLDTDLKYQVIDIIKSTLNSDMENMQQNKPISLLAKWLPSENASSLKTKNTAKYIIKGLNISVVQYRKMLSKLRAYINIVEKQMSANQWEDINYTAVPSKANILYRNAFLRHDTERRKQFLEDLKNNKTKINSSVLFPHEIVNAYYEYRSWNDRTKKYDETLEQLWKNLPDLVKENDTTMVVADGSGSMTCTIGTTNITALSVANALAIYFAERCNGVYKDKYITFSAKPQLVDLSKGNNLRDKINIALNYNEVANTNIEAVFDLILTTAVKSKMKQEDIPKNILILSDMEFDSCTSHANAKLFKTIENNYKEAGYKLPRLIFWNIMSRTCTIPIKENELGVILVSGFSTNIIKMLMSNETDPYQALLAVLNSDRYKTIEDTINI